MLTIVDMDAGRWDDLAELMGERGDPSRCWCQYYRGDGRYEHDRREQNRAAMRRQVTTASVPHGCWPTRTADRWAGVRSRREATTRG